MGGPAADVWGVEALRWLLVVPVLIVFVLGIGAVMFYVWGGAPITTAAIGASIAVVAWHVLRRIDSPGWSPEDDEDGIPDEWPFALAQLAVFACIMALGFWNPWLIVFGWLVFPLWNRLKNRV